MSLLSSSTYSTQMTWVEFCFLSFLHLTVPKKLNQIDREMTFMRKRREKRIGFFPSQKTCHFCYSSVQFHATLQSVQCTFLSFSCLRRRWYWYFSRKRFTYSNFLTFYYSCAEYIDLVCYFIAVSLFSLFCIISNYRYYNILCIHLYACCSSNLI